MKILKKNEKHGWEWANTRPVAVTCSHSQQSAEPWMWIMGISQNYGIFKVEGSCFIATLNKLTTKTTSWQCHCTGCVPAQTLNLLTCTVYWARHKPLAEEEEYLVRNVLEEIVVDGLCIYVHVVWTIYLCVWVSLLSSSPVLVQKAYRAVSEWE